MFWGIVVVLFWLFGIVTKAVNIVEEAKSQFNGENFEKVARMLSAARDGGLEDPLVDLELAVLYVHCSNAMFEGGNVEEGEKLAKTSVALVRGLDSRVVTDVRKEMVFASVIRLLHKYADREISAPEQKLVEKIGQDLPLPFLTPSVGKKARKMSQKDVLKRAEELFVDPGTRRQAVEMLCTSSGVRVTPSRDEIETDRLSLFHRLLASKIFKMCGFVVLERVISSDVIRALRQEQQKHFERRMQELNIDPMQDWQDSFRQDSDRPPLEGEKDAERSLLRYEIGAPLEPPFTDVGVIFNEMVFPVIGDVLGRKVEMTVLSSVTSFPNATTQHWHADAGLLFPDLEVDLPPHALAEFITLTTVTKNMGPTEFLPGSHLVCPSSQRSLETIGGGQVENLCPHASRTVLTTEAPKGSVLLFDYRVVHRGGPNRSSKLRHLLYLTFAQEWWTDTVNWKRKQTAPFDDLSPPQKKLLSRLDTQNYIRLLENKLREKNVPVDLLQSEYQYHTISFSPDKLTNPLEP